jgi:MFS family permease
MGNVSNRVLYVVSLNHATNDGCVYLLSSLFPIVLSIFGISVFQVGIIVAVGYTVNVLFQPVVGQYSQGRDPGKFLASGMALIAVSIVSFIFSTGFLSLLVSVVVLRLGSSFFHPVGISTVSRSYDGPGLQRAMGFQSAFGNLGVLLTFVSAAPLYSVVGWKSTFLVFAVWTTVDILTTLRFLEPRSPDELNPILNKRPGKIGSTRIPAFFVIAAFVSGGTYAVVLNFANIFLGSKSQLTLSQANLLVSAFIGFAFLGALATGGWSRLLPTNVLLAIFYLIASATMTGFILFAGNVLLAGVALLATGFAMSSTYPLTYTSLSNFLGSSNQQAGGSFGVLSSGQTIGASVLGLVSGYVSQFFGFEASFVLVVVLTIVGSLSTIGWIRMERPKGL